MFRPSLLLAACVFACDCCLASELERIATVVLDADFGHDEDISAVATFRGGQFLIVGNDEDNEVHVLRRTDENEYRAHEKIALLKSDVEDEIDIEGIACRGAEVYVVGSHSRKRKKVKEDKSQEKNRERLTENEVEPLRESLFRFRLNDQGELDSEIEVVSLRKRIDEDPILKLFAQIPSKEGGVDIEGIATDGDRLFVGFRGPVLRGGYVPVLAFDFDRPDKADMLFVNLGGRGIRDMVATDRGFLLIAGPVGDEPVSFEVFHWDGEDGVPGDDVEVTPPRSVGTIPRPQGQAEAKAEGIAVIRGDALIVYDSVENGGATRFKLPAGG